MTAFTDEGTAAKCVKCWVAFDEYLKDKSEQKKNDLRAAYEDIPEKDRIFVFGDIDVNDIPIQVVLFNQEEIEDKIRLHLSADKIDDYLAGKHPRH